MATTTVPAPSDSRIPEAPHLFGATALTAADWRELDGKPHGVFVLEERTLHGVMLMGHEFATRTEAMAHMDEVIRLLPNAFDPDHGPVRVVVTQVKR